MNELVQYHEMMMKRFWSFANKAEELITIDRLSADSNLHSARTVLGDYILNTQFKLDKSELISSVSILKSHLLQLEIAEDAII